MSFILRFFPGFTYLKLAMYTAAIVITIGLVWKVYYTVDKRGYNRAITEQLVLQAKQQRANQENSRFVETKYIEKQVIVNRTITKIEKELPNATKNLTNCLLSDESVRLLNDASLSATK